jgi:hypothetical protein
MRNIRNIWRRISWLLLLILWITNTNALCQKRNALDCNAITIKFSLHSGESLKKKIGSLTFNIEAYSMDKNSNGWNFTLTNEKGFDFVEPVNFPLRQNPSQILGAAYYTTAKESLKRNRTLPFLLNDSDYGLLYPLRRDLLWPYSAKDPDRVAEKYAEAFSRIAKGALQLRILTADVSADDKIRSASFEVTFIAPAQFHFDLELAPHPFSCPSPNSVGW